MPGRHNKKKRRYASVRTLHRTLLPMVGLLVLFSAAFSLEAWEVNKHHQVQQLAALAEVGSTSLDSYLSKFEGTLRAVTAGLLAGKVNDAAALEAAVQAVYPEVQSVRAFTLEQGVGDATDATLGRAVFPAPAAYEAGHDALIIERPAWRPAHRDWIIPLRYAIRRAESGVFQAVDASLPLSTAYNLWRRAPLPQGGRLGVIRDDGHLVTLYPLPQETLGEAVYGIARTGGPLHQHVREHGYPTGGTVEGTSPIDGQRRLWVYRRLAHYPLTLYTSLPRAYLWRTWWEQVRFSYLLLLLGAAGGMVVYLWIVHQQRRWEIVREKSERRIRRLNGVLAQRVAQLEASNRELEAFTYTVSHDLRGPLRVIHGFSERLGHHLAGGLDERGAHYVERIKIGARRMGELIDGLLQLSRVAKAKIERRPVDLTHEARSIARELQQQWPARKVSFEADEGVWADGSPALLRDLLRNLLENAWKFTAQTDHARVEFRCERRDGERVFLVRDNGVGFDMRYAGKLFSVFHRLHGADYEGVGIGLASVARIVAMHGGRVWAEAAKNEGATFYFKLGAGTAPSGATSAR